MYEISQCIKRNYYQYKYFYIHCTFNNESLRKLGRSPSGNKTNYYYYYYYYHYFLLLVVLVSGVARVEMDHLQFIFCEIFLPGIIHET